MDRILQALILVVSVVSGLKFHLTFQDKSLSFHSAISSLVAFLSFGCDAAAGEFFIAFLTKFYIQFLSEIPFFVKGNGMRSFTN